MVDLFGQPLTPPSAPAASAPASARKKPLTPGAEPLILDLFGDTESKNADAAPSSAPSGAAPAVQPAWPSDAPDRCGEVDAAGVLHALAAEIGPRAESQLTERLRAGLPVRLDCGTPEIFLAERLLELCTRLAGVARTVSPASLCVVLPHIPDNLPLTLALLRRHRALIASLVDAGIRLDVPLPDGPLARSEVLQQTAVWLRRPEFVAAVTDNADVDRPALPVSPRLAA